jgi:putative tryptophan/tyrosine transport system substrate-binding protein
MRRREFIQLVGGVVAGWPIAARAQQPAMPVIGCLDPGSADEMANYFAAFRKGLSDTGYIEGRNVALEFRWAEGDYDRLPSLAADLVHRQVQVIVASGPAVLPAKAATTTIPIVFVTGADPVQTGLVASLNRPDGNLTGITSLGVELDTKRLQLLHDIVPAETLIAVLLNPHNATAAEVRLRTLKATAETLRLRLDVLNASTEVEIDTAFATLAEKRIGGLLIGGDLFFNTRSDQLGALSLRHAMPTIYQYRDFAAAGGLLSYGGDRLQSSRLAGAYAGRILRGEKLSDLPVQQSTKVELFINLKTAKALGITVPLSLLGRADEVIE